MSDKLQDHAPRCTDRTRARMYRAARLHMAGRSAQEIAQSMGVTHQTVYQWRKHPVYRARVEELQAILDEDEIEDLRLLRRLAVLHGRDGVLDLAACIQGEETTIAEKVAVSREMREWAKWTGATTGITETTRVEHSTESEVEALQRISGRLTDRDAG